MSDRHTPSNLVAESLVVELRSEIVRTGNQDLCRRAANLIERQTADLAHLARMGITVQDIPGSGRAVVDETKPVETRAEHVGGKAGTDGEHPAPPEAGLKLCEHVWTHQTGDIWCCENCGIFKRRAPKTTKESGDHE